MKIINKLVRFLKEVKSELAKVIWPTRRETVVFTSIVLASVGIVATVIWIVDTIFSRIMRLILG